MPQHSLYCRRRSIWACYCAYTSTKWTIEWTTKRYVQAIQRNERCNNICMPPYNDLGSICWPFWNNSLEDSQARPRWQVTALLIWDQDTDSAVNHFLIISAMSQIMPVQNAVAAVALAHWLASEEILLCQSVSWPRWILWNLFVRLRITVHVSDTSVRGRITVHVSNTSDRGKKPPQHLKDQFAAWTNLFYSR